MMREFLQQQKKEQVYCYGGGGDEQYRAVGGGSGGMFTRGMMHYPWTAEQQQQPELSLGPSSSSLSSSSAVSDGCNNLLATAKNKRKPPVWEEEQYSTGVGGQTGIELHLGDHPLPPDWEQCLDLQSGRVYYLNRRTLEKTWEWPSSGGGGAGGGASSSGNNKLDLDLNISAAQTCYAGIGGYYKEEEAIAEEEYYCSLTPRSSGQWGNSSVGGRSSGRSSSNMVAVPCLNCHLLVMLSTSSPSCPNCKYVHSLPSLQRPPPAAGAGRIDVAKPLETLSLLN